MENNNKMQITREIGIEKESIFTEVGAAISCLRKIKAKIPGKTLFLSEKWLSHDENCLVISYDDIESDVEYAERVAEEKRSAEKIQEDVRKRELKREKMRQIAQLHKEIREL